MPEPAERRVLSGWGRTLRSASDVLPVACPGEVAAALDDGTARGVAPRGLGRSYGDAALNAGGHVLDTTGLKGPLALDLATGRVTVGAGTSIGELAQAVVPEGWFVPVTPGTAHVTVGGAIAADVHGKNHPTDGSFGRHVDSFRLVTPEGVRDVDEHHDPDAFRATVGGMGLTGVVTRATLALRPVETATMRVTEHRAADLDAALDALASTPDRYAVAWLDTTATGTRLGRGVVSTAEHANVDELPEALRRHPLDLASRTPRAAPHSPVGLVNRGSVRMLNEMRWRAAPRRPTTRLTDVDTFFYPLDRVADWPTLYGPRGFVQYQLAVPPTCTGLLAAVLEALERDRIPCGLAVLKRFGAGDAAPLSFPVEGWTLALDLPAGHPRLRPLLAGFDEQVAAAGGRVYLAKDACLRPDAFGAMYPRLETWRRTRDRLDPRRRLRTDLARRLDLVADGVGRDRAGGAAP